MSIACAIGWRKVSLKYENLIHTIPEWDKTRKPIIWKRVWTILMLSMGIFSYIVGFVAAYQAFLWNRPESNYVAAGVAVGLPTAFIVCMLIIPLTQAWIKNIIKIKYEKRRNYEQIQIRTNNYVLQESLKTKQETQYDIDSETTQKVQLFDMNQETADDKTDT